MTWPWIMRYRSQVRPRDNGLTLVFGSDGQVSLIGLDDGVAPETVGTFTVSDTAALPSGTYFPPSESTAISSIPNREATSALPTAAPSFVATPSSTFGSSSLAEPSRDSSATATDTDTSLPSIPTVNYPSPTPTAASSSKDHGVGAPFYLAIVLASLSFIGCVAAFIAWWIRSRTRGRALDLDDPWIHSDTTSDTDNFGKRVGSGDRVQTETQANSTRVSEPTVHRFSSNFVAPHAGIPSSRSFPRTTVGAGRYHSTRRLSSYARPGPERLQTGLSVQESMRTLGRLRIANRVPGDLTSGDEGGMNLSRPQKGTEPPPISKTGETDTVSVGKSDAHLSRSDWSLQDEDILLEPPGPATVSWGRRTDNVAALRRSRRRNPQMTVQTYKNARYGGYLYPGTHEESNAATTQTTTTANQDDEKVSGDLFDPPGWTTTLKSSFWQALEAITRTRSTRSEARTPDLESGSRFTHAPRRIASRRLPAPPARVVDGIFVDDSQPQYAEPSLPEESTRTKEPPQSSTYSVIDSLSATANQVTLHTSEDAPGLPNSLLPRVSNLNRPLGTDAYRLRPQSLGIDPSNSHPTDLAATQTNLRKYGHGDQIPSSWSALAASRESQLDLDYMPLPLPRPLLSSGAGSRSGSDSPSVTHFQLAPTSSIRSRGSKTSSMTRLTRLPMPPPLHPESHLANLTTGAATSSHTETESNPREITTTIPNISRTGIVFSDPSTTDLEIMPLRSSTTSARTSALSRKKGITIRRKRPRLPARAPSTASSVQSVESALSVKELAVRRALLERRRRVKAAEAAAHEAKGGEGNEDGSQSAART